MSRTGSTYSRARDAHVSRQKAHFEDQGNVELKLGLKVEAWNWECSGRGEASSELTPDLSGPLANQRRGVILTIQKGEIIIERQGLVVNCNKQDRA